MKELGAECAFERSAKGHYARCLTKEFHFVAARGQQHFDYARGRQLVSQDKGYCKAGTLLVMMT